jgi:spore coat polysaccharide biosynthesis protein SpsF (cytidylyltransferase family)
MMKPRTVAIIQARMGSTRLFGKVMMNFAGRPLLAYLTDRISRARTLDAIVVATTTNSRDNVIIEECERRGIPNFRGSEFDVLGRYVSAARACAADVIVRVTADNPFTDPDSIDRVVDTIVSEGVDYAIETNLPIGVTGEALTWKALTFIDSVAASAPMREHVTLYAKQNPEALRCAFMAPPADCDRPDLSFTVDTLPEYKYAREIAGEFSTTDFELQQLVAVADRAAVGLGGLAV